MIINNSLLIIKKEKELNNEGKQYDFKFWLVSNNIYVINFACH